MELGSGSENARAIVSTPHERKLFNYPLGGLNESTQYEVWVQVITEEGESPESVHALAFTLEDGTPAVLSAVHSLNICRCFTFLYICLYESHMCLFATDGAQCRASRRAKCSARQWRAA